MFFLLFQYLKNYTLFFKKKMTTVFYVIPSTIYLQKISSGQWWLLWLVAGQKFDFFVQKSWFFCNSKHFSQNIMMPCYWYYFCVFYIFHFFQIIMVSHFLAWPDQCFIMFKIRTFSNLPIFHSKQSIIILQFILLIAITCSRGENKKKNCWNNSLIKSAVC